MKALITGGAGFIGSHLGERLARDGAEVVVLDDLSSGKREHLAGLGSALRFLEASVVDLATCRAACEGVEAVFHHAAIPSVPQSVEDPLGSHAANLTGTLNMLVAARDAGVRRFVMAASTSAYGDADEIPTSETTATRPMSPYATQKLASEYYCVNFHQLFGLETFVLRYFNIFGPRQDPDSPYGAVVPKFISALLAGEPPTIHGDGEQSRDFTYVENVVEANLAALRAPASAAGQVYNIASGASYSVNELYEALASITGTALEPKRTEARAGDVRYSVADIHRAEQGLGYQVVTPFREGLEQTVAWFREQQRS